MLASIALHFAQELLVQKFRTRHLPSRLLLPSSSSLPPNFTCIVTGATSGIGLETARQLAEAGAHVILACRNTSVALGLADGWQKQNERALQIEVMELNLLSFASVKSFAASWMSRKCPLHVLINNAGIFNMIGPQRFSDDGYEEHLQVNHLAPSMLTMLLLPSLAQGAPSRIINVSSDMQKFGVFKPNDFEPHCFDRAYSSYVAYSKSKLAQIYYSSLLEKMLPCDAGIHVISVHPGCVLTNVTRTLPKLLIDCLGFVIGMFSFNSLVGARSVLYCATDAHVLDCAQSLKAQGKEMVCIYYSYDCKVTNEGKRARNLLAALEVWEKTNQVTGLKNLGNETINPNKIEQDTTENTDIKRWT